MQPVTGTFFKIEMKTNKYNQKWYISYKYYTSSKAEDTMHGENYLYYSLGM